METLIQKIYDWKKNDCEEKFPMVVYNYLKLLCKIIEYEPNQISNFKDNFNESYLKIYWILLNYLKTFCFNYENIEMIHFILKALCSLLNSDQNRTAMFMIENFSVFSLNMEEVNVFELIFSMYFC